MRIGLVLPGLTETNLKLAKQMGVTDIVSGIGPREGESVVSFRELLYRKNQVADAGLQWSVIESIPMPDCIKLGLPGRDEALENWIASLRNIGAAGIPIICYNWMAVYGWIRTSTTTRVRGDALATSYNHEQFQRGPVSPIGEVSEETLWATLEYFLKAVVPVAEEVGVKLAMHPDDPPLSPVRGVGRIMTSPENYQRMLDLGDSPNCGVTFCQGCFSEMGADIPATIKHFAAQDKLFFAHFRNLRGTADDFCEMFHDDGQEDMFAAMQAYYDAGFEGPMRPDHTPTFEGDDSGHAGYTLLGRLYAVGYMRGLIEAVEKTR